MFELALKSLCAYLIGSFIGALVLGWLRGGIDIRTMGSGNAGGTNAFRTQGAGFAAAVMLIDVGKGVIAVRAVAGADLSQWFAHRDLLTGAAAGVWLQVVCAAAVVIGHVYPVWFEFRGGKGAATLLGVLAALMPSAVLPVLLVWGGVLTATGYVGLATVLASATFPLYVVAIVGRQSLPTDAFEPLLWFGIVMASFVVFTHRANIARMLDGNESRFERVWLLRPRG